MKDLFTGSLGKLNNHGGSRIFTTPNTREVKPDYEIATGIPSIAEFAACSLDGRLWAFRRSKRYYVAVLRWNNDKQQLVFVSVVILDNTNLIGRGVDWLLTDTVIIQASDDEPYVFTANLFNDEGTSFLYSILRSKDLSSGIDSITKAAWGLSQTNGNSEGYGYFNRSALLQSVNKHYSQLPTVGNWHIIKNFLVRKPDNPLSEAHNSMLNIRPLIPLEFNGSTPAYGCGFDNDIFLTYHNGELWGRGLYHIGRCYILPAVFDESGNPQEFYLYISPDYPRIAVAQADKFKLGILKTADNLYGFLTEQVSSLDNGLCYGSDSPKVFDASTKQWQQISESGQMFIDTLNHSGLMLNDDGAIFLNGTSYECKGLKQWLAPAGVVDAVSEQSVISSFDNAAVATYPQQSFHRELLTGKKLPISAKKFSGKRLSLGLNDKKIQVNSSAGTNGVENIAWQNVYKQSVSIRKINSFSHGFNETFANGIWPVFRNEAIEVSTLTPANMENGYSMFMHYDLKIPYFYTVFYHTIEWEPGNYDTFRFFQKTAFETRFGWGRIYTGEMFWNVPGAYYTCNTTLFYIHPDSGLPVERTIHTRFENSYSYEALGDNSMSVGYVFDEEENNIITADCPIGITIQDGQIGYSYEHSITHYPYDDKDCYSETRFKPIVAVSDIIPTFVQDWQNNSDGNLTLQSVQDIACPASAIFSEKNSKAIFAYDISSIFKSINASTSGTLADIQDIWYQYYNYLNINSLSADEASYTQGLHVAICRNRDSEPLFIVFRSEIHPEIFDFKSETERSKLS